MEITSGFSSQVEARNKVLKNTYILLALTLLPTVFGAWLGMETGIIRAMGPTMFLIVFLVATFGLIFLIKMNQNSVVGIGFLLAFTFIMGLMSSQAISHVLHFKNGANLIMLAFGGTATIFAGMYVLAATIKRDLSSMGKFLFIGLLMLIFAGIANMFLHSSVLMIVLSVISIGIFSAYLMYDINKIITGGETNYISATLDIYLDLFNIFFNLLQLLGIFGGDD
jgi:FtsH-binding integral membrane protein